VVRRVSVEGIVGGGRVRPASPGMARLGGPMGMGMEADLGGVGCGRPRALVIDSEARSGSSSDFFFVLSEECGWPGAGDVDRDDE
jgi:hypothetical protein